MGTTFKVMVYARDETTANRAAKAAFARIVELDGIMSDYKASSELMRLCEKAGGDPVKVSGELFYVLQRAQDLSKRSDGAFDVTVGPVTRTWRLARKSKQLPDKEDLATAMKLVGWKQIELDEKKQTVKLATPGMRLDLGGIGKGYTAQEAIKAIQKTGVDIALVAAGGDIVAGGAPPKEKGWKVGIAPVTDPEGKPKQYIFLKDAAVSTSGDAYQYVEIEGKRYSHIVDPKTGIGIPGQFSVTVVAKDGTSADSLTKVIAVLGNMKGLKLIEETPGAAAFIVRVTDKGEETEHSKRWKELDIHTEK